MIIRRGDGGMGLAVQIAAQLRSHIEDGVWLPGEQLPSEPRLRDKFMTPRVGPGGKNKMHPVSRWAVRAAVDALVLEGLVRRDAPFGTFVAPRDEWHPKEPATDQVRGHDGAGQQ